MIAYMPPGGLNMLATLFTQDRCFCHMGLRIKLMSAGYVICYPPKTTNYADTVMCDLYQVLQGWIIVGDWFVSSLH